MNAAETTIPEAPAQLICKKEDLVPNSGVCALWKNQQIAIFYLPESEPSIYVISNWDPIGEAEVLSRGILGDINGAPVVASPLYKQHFDLTTGICIEDPKVVVTTLTASLDKDGVWLHQ